MPEPRTIAVFILFILLKYYKIFKNLSQIKEL